MTAEVPDTLRKLIEQQLGQPGRDDQRLLEAASVAGKEFGTAVVAAAVDRTTEHVETCLDALARRGQFVRAHGVAAWPDGTLASRYTFIHDLYRAALYDRVPAGQRAQWHRHIGLRLEAGYESRAPELATELAEPFARGRETERALRYLQCAGENALRRSAYHEAIAHLTRSLELLLDLPVTPARTLQELHLQVALGAALTANKGFASAEGGHAYTRARELAPQVAETPRSAPILLGLWVYDHVCSELRTAHTLVEEILRQAQTWHDPILLNQAHHAIGSAVLQTYWAGLLVEALKRAGASEEGLCVLDDALATIPSSGERRSEAELYRLRGELLQHMQGNTRHASLTPEVCFQRAIDIARRQQAKGLELRAAMSLSRLWRQRGKHQAAQQLLRDTLVWFSEGVDTADASTSEAERRALSPVTRAPKPTSFTSHPSPPSSVSVVGCEAALAQLHGWLQGACDGARQIVFITGEADLGKTTVVDTFIEEVHKAELSRLQGELLWQRPGSDERVVEDCFQQALDIARYQLAKSLELRAAMSLSRLWQHQGKRGEARQLLEAIYDQFTEGFSTPDLQTAKGIIETLV